MRNLVEAVEEEAAPELGNVSLRFLFQKDCDSQNSGVKISFFVKRSRQCCEERSSLAAEGPALFQVLYCPY